MRVTANGPILAGRTSGDADTPQDLLVAQGTVHYDVRRRVLMFGVKTPGA